MSFESVDQSCPCSGFTERGVHNQKSASDSAVWVILNFHDKPPGLSGLWRTDTDFSKSWMQVCPSKVKSSHGRERDEHGHPGRCLSVGSPAPEWKSWGLHTSSPGPFPKTPRVMIGFQHMKKHRTNPTQVSENVPDGISRGPKNKVTVNVCLRGKSVLPGILVDRP